MATIHLIVSLFIIIYYSKPISANYQFFKFVQVWTTSLCSQTKNPCNRLPITFDFTIHGLWPTDKTWPYPMNCRTIAYDSNLINVLKTHMIYEWPSLTSIDDDFWRHEWLKHGICSENNFKQFDYFKLALNIKDKVDIFNDLIHGQVTPSPTAAYYPSKIKRIIRRQIQVKPELCCNYDSGGSIQLLEIVLCLNDKGKKFINCPSSMAAPVSLCYKQTKIKYPLY